MITYVKTFFFPQESIFIYSSSKEIIVGKVDEILNRKWNLFDSNNLSGEFKESDTFEIRMKSASFGTGLTRNSRLVGEILEYHNDKTEIKLKAKPDMRLYFWFFAFIVFSIVYLIKYINAGSVMYILMSSLMFIGGPSLCIGMSNIKIEAIKENYIKYIDNKLRSI